MLRAILHRLELGLTLNRPLRQLVSLGQYAARTPRRLGG
jgi:hypothetical protein